MMSHVDTNLAVWINNEAKQRGWSLRQVARRSGISHSTVSRLANAEIRATAETCRALALAFGISAEDLFRIADLLPGEEASSNHIRQRRIVYQTDATERLLQLWAALTVEDQQRILDFMERLAPPLLEPRIIGDAPPDA